MSNIILKTENLGIDFGGLTALNNLNLEIENNVIYGLIGPNGAGKTTVFNLLTKVYKPTRGKIFFNDVDLNNKTSEEVNKLGIARTFQNIRLFNNLSVLDNVKVGMHNKLNYNLFQGFINSKKFKEEEEKANNKALELLSIFDLDKYSEYKADSLSYGGQRRLEIVRALATEPKLLLLDEPAAGMNPVETKQLMDNIAFIRDHFKITILLIEHDMKLVMGVCEKITVLNFGQVLMSGSPKEVQNDKAVIKAYIGE